MEGISKAAKAADSNVRALAPSIACVLLLECSTQLSDNGLDQWHASPTAVFMSFGTIQFVI